MTRLLVGTGLTYAMYMKDGSKLLYHLSQSTQKEATLVKRDGWSQSLLVETINSLLSMKDRHCEIAIMRATDVYVSSPIGFVAFVFRWI